MSNDRSTQEFGIAEKRTTNFVLPEEMLTRGFSLEEGALHREGSRCDLGEADVPEGVVSLGNGCFAGCRELKRVSLPGTLRELGMGAFADCVSLEAIVLPAGITRLRKELFSGCENLKEVHIPETVASIGEWAFRGCSSLTSVYLPPSITDICAESFLSCPNLTLVGQSDSFAAKYADELDLRFEPSSDAIA